MGYKSDLDELRRKSPFLSVTAAPLPQPAGIVQPVTYADYQGLAVSKQGKSASWAWDFVVFATTDAAAHKEYLSASGRAPALRSEIGSRLDDENIGVFAKQALVARSWHEADPAKIAAIFNHAIQDVLASRVDSSRALQTANEGVTQLMKQ